MLKSMALDVRCPLKYHCSPTSGRMSAALRSPNPNPTKHSIPTRSPDANAFSSIHRSMFEHTTGVRLNIGKHGEEWHRRRCPAVAASVRTILKKQKPNANGSTETMNPRASTARPHITTLYPTSPCPKARIGTTSSSLPTCISRA